jgi:hypothetical protein
MRHHRPFPSPSILASIIHFHRRHATTSHRSRHRATSPLRALPGLRPAMETRKDLGQTAMHRSWSSSNMDYDSALYIIRVR